MPRPWCWFETRYWLAAGLCLGVLAGPAVAATVLSKKVDVEVRADGMVRELTHLEIKLEDKADLDAWSAYPVYLDHHRRLASFDAWVSGNGGRRKVGRKQQDRMEYSGDGIVESSSYYHVVELTGLEVGSVLEITHAVEIEPYFPSDMLALRGGDAITELEVAVRGAGLRWRLAGPDTGLAVEELADGFVVRGRELAALDLPELAAGGAASAPILRYGWGAEPSWSAVGRWYREVLAGLPRDAEAVRRLAGELTGEEQTPRERLEALLAFLRRKVRYVAVEVGIGGYRPSAPEEVLSRKWGDCKDKSLLLIDLLDQMGIAAHPALVLFADDRRIDVEFPAPAQFNHLIVAVPTSAVEIRDGDPVAGGYLFLDPTQTRGSAHWLHPGVQDQDALVVTAEDGVLVRTPVVPENESRVLMADVTVSETGDAAGRAGLLLRGAVATGFLDQMENAPPERTGEDVLAIFGSLLPGARLSGVGWQEEEGEVPAVRMSLEIEIDGLVAGVERPSFPLPSLGVLPEPRLLDEVETAVAYRARQSRTLWRLRLPPGWCPPRAGVQKVENGLGRFVQTVKQDVEGKVVVERRSELDRPWIEPGELPQLAELALAELRAQKRRIRLVCED